VTFGIPTVTVVFSDEQTKPSELYLAAKDDFSFGMLLGPPSVFLATP